MTVVLAGMTMSLDGFVADPEGGVGGLYDDLVGEAGEAYLRADEARTGAVLMGRRSFDAAGDPDSYADDYEFQVPLFVLTHSPPARAPRSNDRLSVTFVSDGVRSAVTQARRAAGERDVTVVGGASVVRQLLDAGLVDELHVDIRPVLLGGGLRLFDGVAPARFERFGVLDMPGRTGLRLRPSP